MSKARLTGFPKQLESLAKDSGLMMGEKRGLGASAFRRARFPGGMGSHEAVQPEAITLSFSFKLVVAD